MTQNIDFIENLSSDFVYILAIYANHLPKLDCIGGIFGGGGMYRH
jgi:hypothetical protein